MEITIPSDFKKLLVLLNSHKVDYIVVGTYTLALHGHPPFIGDLDGVPVNFLRKPEYIRNKKALGRHKDIADAETLEENDH